MKKYLLVIDLQHQFIDEDEMYDKCLEYIFNHREDYDAVIATIFSQTVDGQTNYNYAELLGYNKCLGCDMRDIDFYPDYMIRKNTYTLDANNLTNKVWYSKDCIIDVMGVDMSCCVLATCFSLWDHQIRFRILGDYVYTTGGNIDKKELEKIMKYNFGRAYVKENGGMK